MSKASNKRIGAVLKEKRESEGNSIRLVAQHTKIDHAVISRIENGVTKASFENVVVLCEYYGYPISRLANLTMRKGKNSNGKS